MGRKHQPIHNLYFSHCRIESPPNDLAVLMREGVSPFARLTTLGLSNTLTTWKQVEQLEPLLPNLEELQLGRNQLASIENVTANQFQKVKWINLEDNVIEHWKDIESLGNLKR